MTQGSRPLRIAILAHSTNPRGGVVHAIELADSLTRLGHEAVVHAPDPSGKGFFRAPLSPAVTVMASPAAKDVADMVRARIADYVRHFELPANRGFDVFHAQDAISGNALATLKRRGLIGRFARTVHHIDSFTDPRLSDWQVRSITEADELLVVSALWQEQIMSAFGRPSTAIGNGVDTERFGSSPRAIDQEVREKYGINGSQVLLAVGGIEVRKNSVRILEAFQQVLNIHRDAQLVIVGGASLLDHASYRRQFDVMLSDNDVLARAVRYLGPVPDADMPSLYRSADALVFPSVKEGFGLVVLEAMASGTPVVTSRMAPFTEYLHENDVVWCDPFSVASIANAIAIVLTEPLHSRLAQRGTLVARQHDWSNTTRAHLPVYERLVELQHA
ncbi:MSMEG_0565 family glycosyltransferase [Bradyrhizobium canariense]|uniref:Glycosyltransferase, MSMEG_0565 family n=1 Tax=Bradyrhizobium canariense TaxID=255045 RepID=A0A1H2APE6_9BRAD|nr:MSMEG_0565 family glycosyltransferase [Bradyrhizobium canariense]SDT47793.1 glycosyltransferase, MSMEG_0565 family [Bradyrhizobium canariense]